MGLAVSKKSDLRAAKKKEEDLYSRVGTLAIEKKSLGEKIGSLEKEKENLEKEKIALEREKGTLEREKQEALEKEQARALEEESKKLKQPWRKFERGGDWNNEYRNSLVQGIRSFKFHGKLEHSKLVLLGPIMAGKSSFISSIASIDKGVISQPTLAGSTTTSFTKRLHQYIPKEQLNGKYRLMDSMGIEEMEEQGFHIQNVKYLLAGNIAPDYEFKPGEIIAHDNPKYISDPSLINKPQCVVIVADSNMLDLDAFSDVVQKKMRKLQDYIREHVVPVVLVLTKIDEICEDEGIPITDIYASRRIQTIMTKATRIFGVPLMNIYPVQNYSTEQDLEDNIDILLLLALRGILRIASDHLEYLDDQTR